jgi:dCMP deaminase
MFHPTPYPFPTTQFLEEEKVYTPVENRPLTQLSKFLPIAKAIAAMSKDPSTQVGAVVLGPDYEIRTTGWNGAPRGCKADEDSRFSDRATRLSWSSHAEANAIAQAASTGTPLKGCAMVVTHIPCSACAKLIVQAGIKRVASPAPNDSFALRWAEDIAVTKALFAECGVKFDTIKE